MARSAMNDSASSQFFICYSDGCAALDGDYAAFGKLVEGMDVVNKIADMPTDYMDRPMEDVVMKKVTVDTFGVEYGEPEKC